MSTKIESYFISNNLYDQTVLEKRCTEDGVKIIKSDKYPGLAMLHYDTRSVHFENKWTEFNRHCRGLTVDLSNKKILSYPFEKFFNVDEQPETNLNVLLKLGDFEVSEKLDGSMILIFKDPNSKKYVATTKGSFDSKHGEFATSIIPSQLKDDKLHEKYTLIFELIDKKFQIVINYAKKGYKSGLYLIGARERSSNRLLSFSEVRELAKNLDLPSPRIYEFTTLSEVIQKSKELPILEEGYVVRFKKNGLLVKFKGDEYLHAHRFISSLSQKAILEALGEGTIKSFADCAPEEYREDVLKDIEKFQAKKVLLVKECHEKFEKAPKSSRKDYAFWVNKNVTPDLRGFMFNLFDSKTLDDKKIYKIIGERNGITAETKI